jgi:hypothetical protein
MKKPFRRAFIEITNKCNLSCGFCVPAQRLRGAASAGIMSVAAFEAAAAQAGPLAKMVSLHVLGEPFMHPQLPEILAVCSRLGLTVNLVTNGTLLDKFGPAVFGESCLSQVSVSLHALADLPEGPRLEMLGKFARFAAGKPARLIVGFRLRGNSGDPFVQKTRAYLLNVFSAGRSVSDRIEGGGIKLRDGVFLNSGELFRWPPPRPFDSVAPVIDKAEAGQPRLLGQKGGTSQVGRGKRQGCLGLRHHFAILCSGAVVPCCADYGGNLSLGNINSAPLAEILTGPEASALRDSIAAKTPMPAYCSTCGFM